MACVPRRSFGYGGERMAPLMASGRSSGRRRPRRDTTRCMSKQSSQKPQPPEDSSSPEVERGEKKKAQRCVGVTQGDG